MESKKCIGQYYSLGHNHIHIECDIIITDSPHPQCKTCRDLIYKNLEIINIYENLLSYLKLMALKKK